MFRKAEWGKVRDGERKFWREGGKEREGKGGRAGGTEEEGEEWTKGERYGGREGRDGIR